MRYREDGLRSKISSSELILTFSVRFHIGKVRFRVLRYFSEKFQLPTDYLARKAQKYLRGGMSNCPGLILKKTGQYARLLQNEKLL